MTGNDLVLDFGFESFGIVSSFAEASEHLSDFGFSASNFNYLGEELKQD